MDALALVTSLAQSDPYTAMAIGIVIVSVLAIISMPKRKDKAIDR